MNDEQKAAVEAGVIAALKKLNIPIPEPEEVPTEDTPEPTEATPEPEEVPTEATPEPEEVPTEATPEPEEVPTGGTPEPEEVPTGGTPEPEEVPTGGTPEPEEVPTEATPEPEEVPKVSQEYIDAYIKEYMDSQKFAQTKNAENFSSMLDDVVVNMNDVNAEMTPEALKLVEILMFNYDTINNAAERLLTE